MADWYASPKGRKQTERDIDEGVRNGTAKFYHGGEIERTDPAVLRDLMGRVNAKKTETISIRIPVEDIQLAKAMGKQMGIGYQTVLKQVISTGLRRAG